MHRVCCVCGIEYGVKPPFDDRVTHGLCRRCLPAELKRIKKKMAALESLATGSEQKNSPYEAAT
jgi:NMD protein affecting ribosome stability and mRNA decay